MKLPRNLLLLSALLSTKLIGCKGTASDATETQNNQTYPTAEQNYITSVYGTAKLVFKNGVVKYQSSPSGVYAQSNQGTVTVYLPHTGGEFSLTVNNPDDPATYVYAVSNGTNLCNDPSFSTVSANASCVNVSGYDAVNNQTFTDEPMIKINHSQATETATFRLQGSEGQTKTMSIFRLYDLLQQGNKPALNLGDFFRSFNVRFNDITNATVVSDATCPALDDGAGNVHVPYNATCLKIKLEDADTVGTNHRYTLDGGTTWQTFNPPHTIQLDVSGLAAGSSQSIGVGVREQVGSVNGNAVWDSKSYTWKVIKDSQPGINLYCTDNISGNTWSVNSGGTCVFSDPRGSTGVQYQIKFTLNDSGTCNVVVYRNGTRVDNQTMPCANLQYSYSIDASEKGTGTHSVSVEIYRTDYGSPVLTGSASVNYRVNTAPTVSLNLQPATMKDGTTAYKFYVNESINGSVQGSDNDGDALSCYIYKDSADTTPALTISNCENPVGFTLSYGTAGNYVPKIEVSDGTDSVVYTANDFGIGGVGVYNQPSIVVSWNPEVIAVGGSSTFSVEVVSAGIVDDNGGGCLLTFDYFCDGYVDATVNGCSTGVVYSVTHTPPFSGTRTDCVEFEDYRGTKVSDSATLSVLP